MTNRWTCIRSSGQLCRVLGLTVVGVALALALAQPAHGEYYEFANQVPEYNQGQLDPGKYFEHASAPWEIGMGLGWWAGRDSGVTDHPFWNILGDGITYQTHETTTIDNLICSVGHRDDFEKPEETEPDWAYNTNPGSVTIQPDRSTTGGAHADDCLADHLKTSWSSLGLAYGQTRMSSADNRVFIGISSFLASRKPYVGKYTFVLPDSGRTYATAWGRELRAQTWPDYKAAIDANTPVLVFVRVEPDGVQEPDTVLLGVGYGEGLENEYICLENGTTTDPDTGELIGTTVQISHEYVHNGLVQYYPVFGWHPLVVKLTPTFRDVQTDDANWEQIEACADYRTGIVGGYGDGTYRPALPVCRDAMAVFIARAVAGGDQHVPLPAPDSGAPHFPDVPAGYWAYRHIEYCYAPPGVSPGQGIVGGFGDGTYRPTLPVDRATMAVFVSRAVPDVMGAPGLSPKSVGSAYFNAQNPPNYIAPATASFPDVLVGHWAYKYIEYLRAYCANGNEVRPYGGQSLGYTDGTYRPGLTVTRDQMAAYIWKAWEYPKE